MTQKNEKAPAKISHVHNTTNLEKIQDMDNIPVKIVAELLGVSEQYVRVGLQQERLPIGSAVKLSSKWTYHISYELLKNYIGEERILNWRY